MKARGRYNVVVTAARQKQILDAAAACFRRDGFRGASMADISKISGLSTGHIYHYFENKEAIVEAIVERGQAVAKAALDRVESCDGLAEAILKVLAGRGSGRENTAEPVLLLESFAEASRNPLVAGLFHEHDILLLANLMDILKAGQAQGLVDRDIDVEQVGLLLKTVLYGFIINVALLPDFDATEFKRLLGFFARAFVHPSVDTLDADSPDNEAGLHEPHSVKNPTSK